MRDFVRNGICALLICALLCLPLGGAAAAAVEDGQTELTDCADDQMAYGARVAELLRQKVDLARVGVKAASRGEKAVGRLTAVLCRTDGQAVDFSPWEPQAAVAGPHDCYTLFFLDPAEAESAAKEIAGLAHIRYAEVDGDVQACSAEDYTFQSYGAENMHFAEYLDYNAQWRDGAATVAVVDSGVYLHPMLTSRILESGYDYIDSDNDATNDLYGHGTNVAGVVADCTSGAPVYILPIRVLNAGGGGKLANVVNGVREAADKGVTVINLSLESKVESQALDEAIGDAVAAGITVVIAAGNSTMDTSLITPAHLTLSGAVVVGAAAADGSRASYSNYGSSVDVYAYGTGIQCCSRTGGYTSATGTSLAAPHIAALSALLRLLHPDLSPAEIEARIVLSTDPDAEVNIPDLEGMIPQTLGFSLSALRMTAEETLPLPTAARPVTAAEEIAYASSDETVLTVTDGVLTPLSPGTATVTASCTGFEESVFTVTVTEDEAVTLTTPAGLSLIGDEAFSGLAAATRAAVGDGTLALGDHVFDGWAALERITLPGTVTQIGDNDFSGAVILCPAESEAERFARENGLSYIALDAAENENTTHTEE